MMRFLLLCDHGAHSGSLLSHMRVIDEAFMTVLANLFQLFLSFVNVFIAITGHSF